MTREEASNYMDSSRYRFPTKEEIVLYSKDDTSYWYDEDKETYDKDFPLYVGQFVYGRKTGKVEVNKNSNQSVLCIEDGSFELQLRQLLINYKIDNICMDEVIAEIRKL